MFTADQGTAPSRKGMKSFCKLGSEGLKGCIGGGSHLYGQMRFKVMELMKDEIGINEVRFTSKLKNHPVCLTSKGNISVEMEKVNRTKDI